MRRLAIALGTALLVGTLAASGIPKETEDYSTLDGPWTVHIAMANGFDARAIESTVDYNDYVASESCQKISHVRIWKKTHDITVICEL